MKNILLFTLLFFPLLGFSQKKKNNKPKKQKVEKPWSPKDGKGFYSIGFDVNGQKWVESEKYGIGCGDRKDVLISKSLISFISGVKVCDDSIKLFQIIWMDSTQYWDISLSENPEVPNDIHFMYINKDSVNFTKGSSNEIYSKIESLSDKDKKEFQKRAVTQLKWSIQIFSEINEIKKQAKTITQRKKLDKFLNKTKRLGLIMLDWSIYDESEYTDGSSVKFEIFNPTKKTIKYIWFYVKGINPVGDPIINRNGKSIVELKGIGPIEPNGSGVYRFKYAWYSGLVEKAKIISIKVQYMDNTIKIIQSPKDIMMPDEHWDFLNSIE